LILPGNLKKYLGFKVGYTADLTADTVKYLSKIVGALIKCLIGFTGLPRRQSIKR